ncbi:hypothetical protein L873DRAFT_1809393 [Choiromyces venosus 120613-1]|uniref:Uncharacterized protein n=1 Tax=Choiromyces venosus 120613-1 TaxID=1336337 RepID=A0A3N4JK25_9PEZI|nr:hypothetical protein L873DRAFT_1809393 [Choiromyces venosus 120613-1]
MHPKPPYAKRNNSNRQPVISCIEPPVDEGLSSSLDVVLSVGLNRYVHSGNGLKGLWRNLCCAKAEM